LEPSSIAGRLKEQLGPESVLDFKAQRQRRVFITLTPETVREGVKALLGMGFKHLSAITGLDTGNEIEVIYHMGDFASVISLRAKLGREKPELASCSDLIPSASIYEREIHDLLGVSFKGHPDLAPLVLPEGWPQGLYPLRKSSSADDITRALADSAGKEGAS
jgi:NADH:ubiquinone oxidoreductase subunit C